MNVAKAIFAGGCFWGLQSAFEKVPGVISTLVGYSGGKVPHPTYMEVASGRTGHAEAVEIMFNPAEVGYDKLLDIFFASHDPTTQNRQAPDVGPQYRSAIFYADTLQKDASLNKIAQLANTQRFKAPIITEVIPAGIFYPAEEYHQHYLNKRGETSCTLH